MATVNLGRLKPVFKGAYNSGTAYVIDDIVTYANETYINIQAGTNQQPNTATGYWTKLAAKGTDGTDVGATLTTQGDILYRDGSGLQRLAKGTASQELRMNSGATAPEWHTPAAASTDIERVVSGAFSGTELIIDNCFTTAYEIYELHLYNIKCSAYHRLQWRTGGASGSTQSGSHYRYLTRYFFRVSGSASDTGENHWSDSSFRIAYDGSGTGGDYGHNHVLTISEPTKANRTSFIGLRNQVSSGSTGFATSGGYYNSNDVVTGFRFYSNSGSSFTVDYALYGRKIS